MPDEESNNTKKNSFQDESQQAQSRAVTGGIGGHLVQSMLGTFALEEGIGGFESSDPQMLHGWFEDAVKALCTGEGSESKIVDGNAQLKAGSGERIDARGSSSVVLGEGGFLKLSGDASGTVENGAVVATERANVYVKGASQAFLHGNATGELYGAQVYGFAEGHSTAMCRDAKLIAAGRASVRAEGGWVGVKDEAVAHVVNGKADVVGHGAVIAEGATTVTARGGIVLVSSADAAVEIRSPDARVIFASHAAEKASIAGNFTHDQLHTEKSAALLELMNELNFRELMHKEPLLERRTQETSKSPRKRALEGVACSPDEESTRLASKLLKASSTTQVHRIVEQLEGYHATTGCSLAAQYLDALKRSFQANQLDFREFAHNNDQCDGSLEDGLRHLFKQSLEFPIKHQFELQAARAGRNFQDASSAKDVATSYLHLAVISRDNPSARQLLNMAIGHGLASPTASQKSASASGPMAIMEPMSPISRFGMALRSAVANDLVLLPREIKEAQSRVSRFLDQLSNELAQGAAEQFSEARTAQLALSALLELEQLLRDRNPYARDLLKMLTGQGETSGIHPALQKLKEELNAISSAPDEDLPESIRDAQRAVLSNPDDVVIKDLAGNLLQERDPNKIQDLLGKLDAAQFSSRAASHILDKLAETKKHYERVMIGQGTGIRVAQAVRLHLKAEAIDALDKIIESTDGSVAFKSIDRLWAQRKSSYSDAVKYLNLLGISQSKDLDALEKTLRDCKGNSSETDTQLDQIKHRLMPVLEDDRQELAADLAHQVVTSKSIQTAKQALESLYVHKDKNKFAAEYCELIPDKDLLQAICKVKRSDFTSSSQLMSRLQTVQLALEPEVELYYKAQALAAADTLMNVQTPDEAIKRVENMLQMYSFNKPALVFLEQLGLGADSLTELHEELARAAQDSSDLQAKPVEALLAIQSVLRPILSGEIPLGAVLSHDGPQEVRERHSGNWLNGLPNVAESYSSAGELQGVAAAREREANTSLEKSPTERSGEDEAWRHSFSNLLDEISGFFKASG